MEIDVRTLNRIIEFQVAHYSRAVLAQVSSMMGDRHAPIGREGIIQSYNPVDGTVEVIFGDGAAIIQGTQGDGDAPPTQRNIPLLTTHHGDQFGPIGGERCIVVPTQSGYAALILYSDDDSPNTPAGERWIIHRDPVSGLIDSYIKFTNAGSATNDGKGGLLLGFGELAEIETIGGHSFVADDVAKTITITASDGTSIVIDANSSTIKFAESAGASTDALVRHSDLVTLLSQIQSALDTWASAHLSNGSGATGPSTLTSINPTASAKSFTA